VRPRSGVESSDVDEPVSREISATFRCRCCRSLGHQVTVPSRASLDGLGVECRVEAVAAALVRLAMVPLSTTSPEPSLLTLTSRPSSCRSGVASGPVDASKNDSDWPLRTTWRR